MVPLCISQHGAESELAKIRAAVEGLLFVEDAGSLRRLLDAVPAPDPDNGPRPLDLIGHAAEDDRLLRLGDLVIDGRDPDVICLFHDLRHRGRLARLHVGAVRLLGCCTAITSAGRATVLALADVLGLPVYGTNQRVHSLHFGPVGLKPRYRHLLVSDRELRVTVHHGARSGSPAGSCDSRSVADS